MRSAVQSAPSCKKADASSVSGALRRVCRLSCCLRAEHCHRDQFLSRHPQVRQRKQRDDVCSVLGQPAEANLRQPELALDDPKRMLDLYSPAGPCGARACEPPPCGARQATWRCRSGEQRCAIAEPRGQRAPARCASPSQPTRAAPCHAADRRSARCRLRWPAWW